MTDYTILTDEQLDRLVAEKAMGWHLSKTGITWKDDRDDFVGVFADDWQPTRNKEQMHKVIDKMIERGYGIHIHWHKALQIWDVIFSKDNQSWRHKGFNDLPLSKVAIIAALKAVE